VSGGTCRTPADADTESDRHEAELLRLRDVGASPSRIAEAALAYLEHLLDIEHLQLAVWHACRYGSSWDDGRKLVILERLWRLGMESSAIQLCHRWGLSRLCEDTKTDLYYELFPPRNKETRNDRPRHDRIRRPSPHR